MPMNFRALLDPHFLTDSYAQRQGVRSYPLTEMFYVNPQNVADDQFDFVFYPAEMEPAPVNRSGDEAHTLATGEGATRKGSLFVAFNKVRMPMDAVAALREPDSMAMQEKGQLALQNVFDRFSERHAIQKELIIAKIMTTGVVYLDAAGNVLESSSGAALTANFDVESTHKTNLNGIISKLWSDPTAKILDMCDSIRDQAESENAEVPTDIWVHTLSKRHLRNNDQFIEWCVESGVNADTILRGDMIEGLGGFTWHFYGGKYKAADGTMTNYIPVTQGILTPPPAGGWLKKSQGLSLVPTDINIVADWQQALNSVATMYGKFSYAKLKDDPLALYLYMGDKFGLNFADPSAVWMPTLFAS